MDDRTWADAKIQGGLARREGDRGTFLVKILYRENHSWQGELIRADTNKRIYFRSALELIKLIDGAFAESGDEKKADGGRMAEEEDTENAGE